MSVVQTGTKAQVRAGSLHPPTLCAYSWSLGVAYCVNAYHPDMAFLVKCAPVEPTQGRCSGRE